MSGGLVRLIKSVMRASQDKSDAAPAVAEPRDNRPPIVREIDALLSERFGAQRPEIFRYTMTSEIEVVSDPDGTLVPQCTNAFLSKEPEHRDLFTDGGEPAELPLALYIERVGYDTSRMPVDVQIEFRGLRPQFVVCSRDQSLDRTGAALRDDVLLGGQSLLRDRKTLLSSALLFTEPLSGTRFSSIEAIGFSGSFFFMHVAQRVPERLTGRLQRLFWAKQAVLSPSNSAKSLHAGAGIAAFYWVPLTYQYTALLRSVHTYLVVQQACQDPGTHFDARLTDGALYELPHGHNCLLFDHADLHRAVDFIEERLLGVHPRLLPNDTLVDMEPFGSLDWNTVVEERGAVGLGGAVRTGLVCMVQFVVYYAFFSRADEQPPSTNSRSTPSASSYEGSADDQSLEFTTPRTVVNNTPRLPTPRLPTADAFVAASATLSDTLPDYQALVQSPLRLALQQPILQSPLRVVSPRHVMPSAGDVVLDHERSGPTDASGTSPPGESTEARYAVARAVLATANAHLRATGTTKSTEDEPGGS